MGKSPAPVRLDALLVKRGLAASRQRAQALIEEGQVKVNGLVAQKAAMRVRPDQPIELVKEDILGSCLETLGVLEPFSVEPRGVRLAHVWFTKSSNTVRRRSMPSTWTRPRLKLRR